MADCTLCPEKFYSPRFCPMTALPVAIPGSVESNRDGKNIHKLNLISQTWIYISTIIIEPSTAPLLVAPDEPFPPLLITVRAGGDGNKGGNRGAIFGYFSLMDDM